MSNFSSNFYQTVPRGQSISTSMDYNYLNRPPPPMMYPMPPQQYGNMPAGFPPPPSGLPPPSFPTTWHPPPPFYGSLTNFQRLPPPLPNISQPPPSGPGPFSAQPRAHSFTQQYRLERFDAQPQQHAQTELFPYSGNLAQRFPRSQHPNGAVLRPQNGPVRQLGCRAQISYPGNAGHLEPWHGNSHRQGGQGSMKRRFPDSGNNAPNSNSNGPGGKKSKKNVQKVDKRDLPENNVFVCEACDRGFKLLKTYEEHIAAHQKQHRTGLASKIWKLESKEDLEKWREERRKNYPTVENVKKKKEERRQRIARGDVLDNKYFGRMRGRGGGRGQGRGRGRYNGHRDRNGDQGLQEDEDDGNRDRTNHHMKTTEGKLTSPAKTSQAVSDNPAANCDKGLPSSNLSVLENVEVCSISKGRGQLAEQADQPIGFAMVNSDIRPGVSASINQNSGQLGRKKKMRRHKKKNKNTANTPNSHGNDGADSNPADQEKASKRRPALLEQLLASDIRRERNIILQCVRYIVQNLLLSRDKDKPHIPCEQLLPAQQGLPNNDATVSIFTRQNRGEHEVTAQYEHFESDSGDSRHDPYEKIMLPFSSKQNLLANATGLSMLTGQDQASGVKSERITANSGDGLHDTSTETLPLASKHVLTDKEHAAMPDITKQTAGELEEVCLKNKCNTVDDGDCIRDVCEQVLSLPMKLHLSDKEGSAMLSEQYGTDNLEVSMKYEYCTSRMADNGDGVHEMCEQILSTPSKQHVPSSKGSMVKEENTLVTDTFDSAHAVCDETSPLLSKQGTLNSYNAACSIFAVDETFEVCIKQEYGATDDCAQSNVSLHNHSTVSATANSHECNAQSEGAACAYSTVSNESGTSCPTFPDDSKADGNGVDFPSLVFTNSDKYFDKDVSNDSVTGMVSQITTTSDAFLSDTMSLPLLRSEVVGLNNNCVVENRNRSNLDTSFVKRNAAFESNSASELMANRIEVVASENSL